MPSLKKNQRLFLRGEVVLVEVGEDGLVSQSPVSAEDYGGFAEVSGSLSDEKALLDFVGEHKAEPEGE